MLTAIEAGLFRGKIELQNGFNIYHLFCYPPNSVADVLPCCHLILGVSNDFGIMVPCVEIENSVRNSFSICKHMQTLEGLTDVPAVCQDYTENK